MDFIFNIMKSSREFDSKFELDSYSWGTQEKNYLWKSHEAFFFHGCDTLKVFPLAINLYLNVCSEGELYFLFDKKCYLRVRMFYEDKACTVSCIKVYNLAIGGLEDPNYKNLLLSCPKDMVPVEMNLGPLWYYMGFNKVMCQNRRIELVGNMFSSNGFSVEFVAGSQLYGRDAYPKETEEEIKMIEEEDDIFILRK